MAAGNASLHVRGFITLFCVDFAGGCFLSHRQQAPDTTESCDASVVDGSDAVENPPTRRSTTTLTRGISARVSSVRGSMIATMSERVIRTRVFARVLRVQMEQAAMTKTCAPSSTPARAAHASAQIGSRARPSTSATTSAPAIPRPELVRLLQNPTEHLATTITSARLPTPVRGASASEQSLLRAQHPTSATSGQCATLLPGRVLLRPLDQMERVVRSGSAEQAPAPSRGPLQAPVVDTPAPFAPTARSGAGGTTCLASSATEPQ